MNISKGEQVWVRYYNDKGSLVYILTSKIARDYYFLYKAELNGNLIKLGKARTPTELEKKFNISAKIRE